MRTLVRPLLLQRYPSLHIPWLTLGREAPVIRPLERGWVLDEGRCAPVFGGNKVRKLEHLLAAARVSGAREVLTLGAVGSHHVLATAIHAREVGLSCRAVLVPQPDTPHVRAVARLIQATATAVRPTRRRHLATTWARAMLHRPHVIAAGGSDALGTVGWISAGLELADAVASGHLPRLDRVVLALGSAGTAAGLWAGLRLASLDAEVVAVRVVDRALTGSTRVRRLAQGALSRVRAGGVYLPEVRLEGLRIEHRWFTGGYGHFDDRVLAAREHARSQGLHLETTYTAKAWGAFQHELLAARPHEVVLFVQTVNTHPLGEVLATAPALRPKLAALLR